VPGSFDVTFADEISMSDDGDGILGNLPRSRPGVRSEKRASTKRAAPKQGAAVKPKPAAKPRTTAKKPRPAAPAAPPRPSAPAPPPSSGDPIGVAVKAAGQVAETGLKVAARVAGGVLRRLPRP
jgi:hypothetical protein